MVSAGNALFAEGVLAVSRELVTFLLAFVETVSDEREALIGPFVERLGGKDIIEISTETSETLVGSVESGVFVLQAL